MLFHSISCYEDECRSGMERRRNVDRIQSILYTSFSFCTTATLIIIQMSHQPAQQFKILKYISQHFIIWHSLTQSA